MRTSVSPAEGSRPAVRVAALAAAWLLTAAWLYRGLFMDDAYIGFRYVSNLLDGHGFTFNPPVRVEGVTNTGWLLFLAPLAAVLGPPLAAKVLALALLAATLALVAVAAAPADRPVPVLTVLATAFHAELVGFSLLGMETALLAALATAIVVLAERRRLGWLPEIGTFAFLVHPEAVLVVPLGAFLAWRARALSLREAVRTAGFSVLGLAAVTLVRWLWFGAFLPNTFAAKPAVSAVVRQNLFDFVTGSSVNVGVPFAGLFALPFVVVGWRALRRTAPLTASFAAAAGLAGFAFALYARPDWTLLARYFAPYAPAVYLLLWNGLLEAERALLARDRWAPRAWKAGAATTVVAVLVAVHGAVAAARWTTERSRSEFPGYILTSRTLVEPALWMRDHLPPGSIIATRRIGALSYYSGLPVFDYSFGLTEPAVARLIRQRGGAFASPADPELADLWRELAPDYILEDRDILYRTAAAVGGTPASFKVHGIEYGVVRPFRIAHGIDWILAARRRSGRTGFPN